MGHTAFENLKDLSKELAQIRKIENLKEKKPGVFYFKSTPFLHFHDKDGIRWAHLKTPEGWLKVDLDFQASAKIKQQFLKSVHSAYKQISS